MELFSVEQTITEYVQSNCFLQSIDLLTPGKNLHFYFIFYFLPADPDTFLAGLSVRRSCAKPLGNQTPETIIASLQPVADTPP